MAKKGAIDEDEALPALGPNATQGQLGEALVEATMLQLGQLYDRRAGLDFGVDGVIELTTGDTEKRATGRQVGVQVKRGLSNIVETRYGFTHYCTEAHANYWLRHSLPIIVVHSDPTTGRLRWRDVSSDTLRRTPKGYAIDLPPESELRTSLDAIRALADGKSVAPPAERTFLLPYSIQEGVRVNDADLGLAALEFSRAVLRGEKGRVVIDVEEEPDLVASIDAIRDRANPSFDDRRDALIREDILARYRKRAAQLQRALQLLLTEKQIIEFYGYRDRLLAVAIRWLTHPNPQHREPGDVALQAWPTYSVERPVITFDVPVTAMEALYAKNDANRVYIRMGEVGGTMIGDLDPDIVARRFLPVLALRLIGHAEACEIPDDMAFERIGIPPSMWLMGMA
ncbi:DUF4365 domain-containing protein [Sinorhizobium meliloti]|uniref:DUF4365 domain-containing protein n=1 Tax=Rhizobium meliloti TaxID=382 RepID=UPI000FD96D6E|nr:DUF4365 domain-containing protein [Sinorhizobium meliloti]RVP98282.1 DUF4365 domain-containing protein [Sinorhizobium meliloti]